MSIQPLPLSYRAALLQNIHKHLQAGKCGALVGVASCGKSRLVEFMGRPDVRQHYLGEDWAKVLFPWVDGNDLLEYSEWGMCEKALSAILADLTQLPDGGGEARQKAEDWYWKLVRPENRPLARRLLALAIADLKGISRVVLLLDDFDGVAMRVDDTALCGLRGLRDVFKKDYQYRLLYLLFLRRQPVSLRETTSDAYENFVELFKNFTHPLGCYERDDALTMIRRLSEAFRLEGRILSPEMAERLYEVTGGHAGLIDAAFHSGTEGRWGVDLVGSLLGAAGVWNECDSIWEGLDEEEQSALFEVARGRDPGVEATRWLEQADVIRRADGAPRVIELLRVFLLELDKTGPDVRLDPERRTLTANGCVVDFTEREFALAQALVQSQGKWRSHLELYQVLYPGRAPTGPGSAASEVRDVMQRVSTKLRRTCGGRPAILEDTQRGYRML